MTSHDSLTTTKRVSRRLAAAAVLAATVGFGLSVVAPTGIAHARLEYCNTEVNLGSPLDVREFRLQYPGDDTRHFTVEVMAAMPQSDAQKFVDRPGDEAIFRLWGDDEWDDDLLSEFRPQTYWADPAGLGMRGSTIISASKADEDTFPDTSPTDEWYTGIRLTDIRNGSEQKVETCRLTNEF